MMKWLWSLKKKCSEKKGFTLIELIVVVAIIAILIALIVPNVLKFIQTTQQTAANANAKMCFVAAQTLLTEKFTKKEGCPATLGKDEIKGYVADQKSVTEATSLTIDVDQSTYAVESVTWVKGGITGTYPTETTTPPAGT